MSGYVRFFIVSFDPSWPSSAATLRTRNPQGRAGQIQQAHNLRMLCEGGLPAVDRSSRRAA
jgi:hypothetical protein